MCSIRIKTLPLFQLLNHRGKNIFHQAQVQVQLQVFFIIKDKFVIEEEDGNDLDDYLTDRREKLTEDYFDILKWWKEVGSKYKIVKLMERDVLVVQVSTVVSESTFSLGGRILDPFRSSLSPKMVEALVCLKNWLTCEESEPIFLKSIWMIFKL